MLAVGAAAQNLMLALHAKGIGTVWKSGPVIEADEVKELINWTGASDRIIGLLAAGYAAGEKAIPKREPSRFEEVTKWY